MLTLPVGHKVCPRCTVVKSLDAFGKMARARDGRQVYCTPCRAEIYLANRPAVKARMRDYYRKNAKNIIARVREYAAANQDKISDGNRRRYAESSVAYKRRVAEKATARDKANPGLAAHRVALRRSRLKHATPAWLSQKQIADIKSFYISADALNMLTGIWHEVDHIVPLQGKTVCGLHAPWNLQILTAVANTSKSNRHWPDQP